MRKKRDIGLNNLFGILILLVALLFYFISQLGNYYPIRSDNGLSIYFQPSVGVVLTGTDGSTNPEEDYFEIRRADVTPGIGSGTYTIITSADSSSPNYIAGISGTGEQFNFIDNVADLVEGYTYSYQARSVNFAGSSDWVPLDGAEIIIPPLTPTDLTLNESNETEASFTWTDNSGVEQGYTLERADSADFGSGLVSICDTAENIVSCIDTEVSSGATYHYRVYARGEQYNSGYAVLNDVLIPGDPTPDPTPDPGSGPGSGGSNPGSGGGTPITYECNDGIDNDGDGDIDLADAGCSGSLDDSESSDVLLQCNDGIDNDNDGQIDYPNDAGCIDETDNWEGNDDPTITVPPLEEEGISVAAIALWSIISSLVIAIIIVVILIIGSLGKKKSLQKPVQARQQTIQRPY